MYVCYMAILQIYIYIYMYTHIYIHIYIYTYTELRKHDLFLFRQLAAEGMPKDKLDLSKATENCRRRECYTWLAVSTTMPIVPFPVNHTNFMPMLCKSRQGMSPPPTTYYLRPIEEAPPRAAVQNQHST